MSPSEVCAKLGIQPSTLRKYSLLFEKEQITFARNKNNSRRYTDIQVEAIERAITLSHNVDITLEDAVREASKALKTESIITAEVGVMPVTPQRHNDDITGVMLEEILSLKEIINKYEEAAKKREEERKERELFLVEALEKRDEEQKARELRMAKSLEMLMEKIERLENQKPPSAEEVPEEKKLGASQLKSQQQASKKKGFFARLFKGF